MRAAAVQDPTAFLESLGREAIIDEVQRVPELMSMIQVRVAFDKFVRLLAVRVGTEFNASSLSREVGVSSNTISEWLSLHCASYIVFPLRPYFGNLAGKTLRPEYAENMNKVKQALGDVASATVIYDGESIPPVALNIRAI